MDRSIRSAGTPAFHDTAFATSSIDSQCAAGRLILFATGNYYRKIEQMETRDEKIINALYADPCLKDQEALVAYVDMVFKPVDPTKIH